MTSPRYAGLRSFIERARSVAESASRWPRRSSTVVDMRPLSDPRKLRSLRRHHHMLLELPLSHGVGHTFFPLDPDGCHPYIVAIRGIIDANSSLDAMKGILARYFGHVVPSNAASWLGLRDEDVPRLAAVPPWAVVLPWDSPAPERAEDARREGTRRENLEAGTDIGIDHGCAICGPVSLQKLEVEVSRLERLIDSLQRDGFQRHSGPGGDIEAVILMDGDDGWRWLIRAGQHRAAAASACGIDPLPVRVVGFVRRDEVMRWPNVRSNVYSRAAALRTFDRCFHAKPSSINDTWIRSL